MSKYFGRFCRIMMFAIGATSLLAGLRYEFNHADLLEMPTDVELALFIHSGQFLLGFALLVVGYVFSFTLPRLDARVKCLEKRIETLSSPKELRYEEPNSGVGT